MYVFLTLFIGSFIGDGIVFKHKALIVFKNKLGDLPIDPSRDYDIYLPETEDDKYPHMFPLKMATLIIQHSASIPDNLSITYTPTSKWNEMVFGVQCKNKGDEGVNALLRMGLCGGGGGSSSRKRPRLSCGLDSPSASSVASGCSTSLCCSSPTGNNQVPRWIMNGFVNALHRVSLGNEVFSIANFRQEPANLDGRGIPEIAQTREYAGDSFAVRKAPCIVSAALDGVVSVHKGNKSYIWIAKKAKISGSGEELVYMKCWDPDCQSRVKKSLTNGLFDHCGWALLDKNSMSIIDRSV